MKLSERSWVPVSFLFGAISAAFISGGFFAVIQWQVSAHAKSISDDSSALEKHSEKNAQEFGRIMAGIADLKTDMAVIRTKTENIERRLK